MLHRAGDCLPKRALFASFISSRKRTPDKLLLTRQKGMKSAPEGLGRVDNVRLAN